MGDRNVVLARPFVLGILNVTPDSFSDGGKFDSVDAAIAHAGEMLRDGADAIDIGGESTRPQGAVQVDAEEELRRILPVVRGLRASFPDLLLSVDTTKSDVAREVMQAGADIINDVSGFRLDPRIGEIVATSRAGVVLMHSRGGVSEMSTYRHAEYDDVVGDVIREMGEGVERATAAGVPMDAIVLDPGIGFAKRSEHSLSLLNELPRLTALGRPILVGVSRKRFIGELSGVERPEDRNAGTIGANVAALVRGARLFRVHDVKPNREALDVAWGIVRTGTENRERGTQAVSNQQPAISSQFPVPGSRPK